MNKGDLSEVQVAAAILGRLYPPLDLAAEDLYVQVTAGERIDVDSVPESLGFGTGVLDHVMIEAFKACAPAVKWFLVAGGLPLIADWMQFRRAEEHRIRELEALREERRAFRESLDELIRLFARIAAVDPKLAQAKIIQVITRLPEQISASETDQDR